MPAQGFACFVKVNWRASLTNIDKTLTVFKLL